MDLNQKVRLDSVEGDQSEFSDLIGKTGQLFISDDHSWFNVKHGGCVSLYRKRVTIKGDKIRVSTKLGNVFNFISN